MNFATVSDFEISEGWILRQFQILKLLRDGFCDSFRFWSSRGLDFATVARFEAAEGWILRQFQILELPRGGFCDSCTFLMVSTEIETGIY